MPVDALAQNAPTTPLYHHGAFVAGQQVNYAPPFPDMRHAGCSGLVTVVIGHSAIVQFASGSALVDLRNLR